MPIRSYRFDAPPGHTLEVGAVVYSPGSIVELEEALAVDDRLTLLEADDEGDAAVAVVAPDAALGEVDPPLTQEPDADEYDDEVEDDEELDDASGKGGKGK